MKEAVRAEILKLLDAGIIYPILDSAWISPVQVMLERLAGHSHYCFLDGYSGYNQIPVTPGDQEKTTFTCPYGLLKFSWMTSRSSFDECLEHLNLVLQRCKETNLVLNWEKCHFMVQEGIVLGRFIKDFSKVTKPLCNLLMKDVTFEFNEECLIAFNTLKEKLTTAPVIVAPD
ncbi:uncharacterized protein LOC111406653 [Olea europaea var. sylvestris]|uniref:uncharacterized protein LOC111406653 n=1 Tax=Olea europaea var. sylvestris TaxID=158386 RepID=UPI000C1CDB8E|nr:uncharacterized protein LOC111406653 [Olea europaea var. sylvestris]